MKGQGIGSGRLESTGQIDSRQRTVLPAGTKFDKNRNRNRPTHRLYNGGSQRRLLKECRSATPATDRSNRTSEVEIDPEKPRFLNGAGCPGHGRWIETDNLTDQMRQFLIPPTEQV